MRLGVLLVVALLLGGCGAPEAPLRMGFKEVASDVVLGDQTTPAPPAGGAPSGPFAPLPPSIVALPPPPFEFVDRPPPAAPARPACPSADPLEAPSLEAGTTIDAPPADGQYVFRNRGTFEVSGPEARRGTFPETSLRTVKVTFRSEDARVFDFTVAETLGDITTTTTYRVVRTAAVGTAEAADAGIYIRQVQSSRPGESPAVFTPIPELRLAALPLVRGAQEEARGVDPTTAATMSFTSTVSGKARVDACGKPLDSFTLDLTDGSLLSPSQNLEFAATYAVGTQFGGLVLRDSVAFTGTDGGAGISRSNTSTISKEPARPPGSRQ